MVKVRRAVAGSNTGGCSRASIPASTCLMAGARSSARCVGTMPRWARANSGSPKLSRRRVSMPLIAGWVSPRRIAARVTLHSSSKASNALSRLRSMLLISFILMAKSI
ncbi:hypothetical protein D3C86_1730900 [compost metagenome]